MGTQRQSLRSYEQQGTYTHTHVSHPDMALYSVQCLHAAGPGYNTVLAVCEARIGSFLMIPQKHAAASMYL